MKKITTDTPNLYDTLLAKAKAPTEFYFRAVIDPTEGEAFYQTSPTNENISLGINTEAINADSDRIDIDRLYCLEDVETFIALHSEEGVPLRFKSGLSKLTINDKLHDSRDLVESIKTGVWPAGVAPVGFNSYYRYNERTKSNKALANEFWSYGGTYGNGTYWEGKKGQAVKRYRSEAEILKIAEKGDCHDVALAIVNSALMGNASTLLANTWNLEKDPLQRSPRWIFFDFDFKDTSGIEDVHAYKRDKFNQMWAIAEQIGLKINHVVFTKSGWHIWIKIERTHDPEYWKKNWGRYYSQIMLAFTAGGVEPDKACKDLARAMRIPGQSYMSGQSDGKILNVIPSLAVVDAAAIVDLDAVFAACEAIAPLPQNSHQKVRQVAKKAITKADANVGIDSLTNEGNGAYANSPMHKKIALDIVNMLPKDGQGQSSYLIHSQCYWALRYSFSEEFALAAMQPLLDSRVDQAEVERIINWQGSSGIPHTFGTVLYWGKKYGYDSDKAMKDLSSVHKAELRKIARIGFTPTMVINYIQLYLDEMMKLIGNDRDRLIAIKSPKGTGKTELIGRYIQEAKGVTILLYARRSLISAAKGRLKVLPYEDWRTEMAKPESERDDRYNLKAFSACIDSIHPNMFRGDYSLIFDEAEQTFKHLCLSSTHVSKARKIIGREALTAIVKARKTILLDAGLTDWLIDTIASVLGGCQPVKILNNTKQQGYTLKVLHSKTDALDIAREVLNTPKGKLFIFTDGQKITSRTGTQFWREWLRLEGVPDSEILVIDSQTMRTLDDAGFNALAAINEKVSNHRAIVGSPTAATGISIDGDMPEGSAVIGLFTGTLISDDARQFLARVRDTSVPRHVYVGKQGIHNHPLPALEKVNLCGLEDVLIAGSTDWDNFSEVNNAVNLGIDLDIDDIDEFFIKARQYYKLRDAITSGYGENGIGGNTYQTIALEAEGVKIVLPPAIEDDGAYAANCLRLEREIANVMASLQKRELDQTLKADFWQVLANEIDTLPRIMQLAIGELATDQTFETAKKICGLFEDVPVSLKLRQAIEQVRIESAYGQGNINQLTFLAWKDKLVGKHYNLANEDSPDRMRYLKDHDKKTIAEGLSKGAYFGDLPDKCRVVDALMANTVKPLELIRGLLELKADKDASEVFAKNHCDAIAQTLIATNANERVWLRCLGVASYEQYKGVRVKTTLRHLFSQYGVTFLLSGRKRTTFLNNDLLVQAFDPDSGSLSKAIGLWQAQERERVKAWLLLQQDPVPV